MSAPEGERKINKTKSASVVCKQSVDMGDKSSTSSSRGLWAVWVLGAALAVLLAVRSLQLERRVASLEDQLRAGDEALRRLSRDTELRLGRLEQGQPLPPQDIGAVLKRAARDTSTECICPPGKPLPPHGQEEPSPTCYDNPSSVLLSQTQWTL